MMITPKNRLVIIADDLTGAMDASGFLAGGGLRVIVYPGRTFELAAGVNTDSRSDPAPVAVKKLLKVSRRLASEVVFKKIDSTLRGNVALEITTLLETGAYEKIIITPAFPAVGRTVVNGILLVKGVPVAETDFGRDPVNPVKESFIPALFERETGDEAGIVTLENVAKGPEHLACEFSARKERILVCDATEQTHLRYIVEAAATMRNRLLLAGSGGLAREVHILLKKRPENRTVLESQKPGPALLVIGSRHPASAAQLLRVQNELGMALLKIDTTVIEGIDGKSREIARLVREAGVFLDKGMSVALTSTFSFFAPGQAKNIAAALAEVTEAVLRAYRIGGLFLSGGDTAMAVCVRLGVTAIRVYGEIQPGIPAGEITIGQNRVCLVTKAGGFGGELAIIESMPYLERGTL
jgi:uncharacterized protein YgbK (DUF1537 family)